MFIAPFFTFFKPIYGISLYLELGIRVSSVHAFNGPGPLEILSSIYKRSSSLVEQFLSQIYKALVKDAPKPNAFISKLSEIGAFPSFSTIISRCL